jgi:SAM-dependent methyltransferase
MGAQSSSRDRHVRDKKRRFRKNGIALVDAKVINNAVEHYNADYFESHYGRQLNDSNYAALLGEFYRQQVFERLVPGGQRVLDYGAGHGHLTCSINADCYDPSESAQRILSTMGRIALADSAAIPSNHYDVVFSSHSLEHSIQPRDELLTIYRVLKGHGTLVLILPLEQSPGRPIYASDDNQHLYAWNFQCITNLLLNCGFEIKHQEVFYGPFMLATLSRSLLSASASRIAAYLGRLKRQYPSLLTVAERT